MLLICVPRRLHPRPGLESLALGTPHGVYLIIAGGSRKLLSGTSITMTQRLLITEPVEKRNGKSLPVF